MTFMERRQRVTDTSGTLLFLELSAPSFSAPAYLVNDTRNWTSNGREYVGIPFGFTLPDDVSGQVPKAQLVMENVGRAIGSELERLGPNEFVKSKFLLSDRSAPDVIERDITLPITGFSVTGTTATATGGADYIMRQQAVRLRFNPFTTPGVFS